MRFCGFVISILVGYTTPNIIEIKSIPTDMIQSIMTDMEIAAFSMLESRDESSLETVLAEMVLPPCLSVLRQIGLHEHDPFPLGNMMLTLTFIRKIVLLVDNAIVSYVSSYCATSFSESDQPNVLINDGADWFAFRCYWARLACLDGFLDKRRVWVFYLFNKSQQQRQDDSSESLAVLTRVSDLADI